MTVRSRWRTAVAATVTAVLTSGCGPPPGSPRTPIDFGSRTAWPVPTTPLPDLDPAAAAAAFQQRDDELQAARNCWYAYLAPKLTRDTLPEARRRSARVATAYREFADTLRANLWPAQMQPYADVLARSYDDDFVQYRMAAEADSVDRMREVRYWMHGGTEQEFAARRSARSVLRLPPDREGAWVLGPEESPPPSPPPC